MKPRVPPLLSLDRSPSPDSSHVLALALCSFLSPLCSLSPSSSPASVASGLWGLCEHTVTQYARSSSIPIPILSSLGVSCIILFLILFRCRSSTRTILSTFGSAAPSSCSILRPPSRSRTFSCVPVRPRLGGSGRFLNSSVAPPFLQCYAFNVQFA